MIGYVDASGKEITEPIFVYGSDMRHGIALVRENADNIYYIDSEGKRIGEEYADGYEFDFDRDSFIQHYICLICELSSYPYHDHLAEEPEIWEHAAIIPNMEVAVVQACRSVEGILGEPPNSQKQGAVMKHKKRWEELTGINPDSIFEKANMSYWDFYYKLFFELRNPSAHSYGNINYKLEKAKTVQAQCFAAIIVRDYFNKHVLELKEAQKKLNFNLSLLDRVSDVMSTKITK